MDCSTACDMVKVKPVKETDCCLCCMIPEYTKLPVTCVSNTALEVWHRNLQRAKGSVQRTNIVS
jgi:hypothetical protein